MQRRFILGEKWLYYKIYCGVRSADNLLPNLVLTLTKKLQRRELIDQWFFIRYSDPETHIRLRLKVVDIEQLGKIIAICKEKFLPYLQERLIWNIETGTYVRELERYGTNTIELSEELFFHDSELIINALSLIEDEELYFLFMLKCLDNFLTQFQLRGEEKIQFLKTNGDAFKQEYEFHKETKLSLSKKYRGLKYELNIILNNQMPTEFESLQKLLNKRDKGIHSIIESILLKKNNSQLDIEFENLLASYIHMFVNRAFRDRQRLYELISYDFLLRFSISSMALQQKK